MTPYWSLRFFLGLNVLANACIASGPEVIRKRGGNPIDTLEQQARWLREKADNNIPVNAEIPQVAATPQGTP